MKPRKERSDGVGPGRLGGIPCFIYAEKEGLLLVSDECWVGASRLIRTFRMQSVGCFQIFIINRSPRVSSTSATCGSSRTTYRWHESSGGKVLKSTLFAIQLSFRGFTYEAAEKA